MNNNPIKTTNQKIIKALKKDVTNLGVTRVAEKCGIERTTIYFHLEESRAENVNLDALKKISDAVNELKKEDLDLANMLSKQIQKQ